VPWDGISGKPESFNQGKPPFSLSTHDPSGAAGSHTSITIGADGLGLISYYDSTNGSLKVAHCSNPACTTAAISTPDTSGGVGGYTSITIGVDGLGLISYSNSIFGYVQVAHCEDERCSSANSFSAIGSVNDVAQDISITIGADGLGLISYHDSTEDDLKVAHCSDIFCSASTLLSSTAQVMSARRPLSP
jgi:preprotein translocase subunit Sec61beta